jgi:hypothetical protein
MKILRLEVEREHIREDGVHAPGDVLRSLGTQVRGRHERRRAAAPKIILSFRSLFCHGDSPVVRPKIISQIFFIELAASIFQNAIGPDSQARPARGLDPSRGRPASAAVRARVGRLAAELPRDGGRGLGVRSFAPAREPERAWEKRPFAIRRDSQR